jgi:hypothetical protein
MPNLLSIRETQIIKLIATARTNQQSQTSWPSTKNQSPLF